MDYNLKTVALLLCTVYVALFISSIYIWDILGFENKDRNNKHVILRRSFSISFTSFLSLLALKRYLTISESNSFRKSPFLSMIGFSINRTALIDSLKIGFITTFFFFGHQTHSFIVLIEAKMRSKEEFRLALHENDFTSAFITKGRSLVNPIFIKSVLLAPIFEELIYRSVICTSLAIAKFSVLKTTTISSLLFCSCLLKFFSFRQYKNRHLFI
ncbi:hypothetical protein MHBO_005284 [Bonamia ostreae]|uniref:intramembrane prenyl-peptidase Rce1 n=1 Tax=Bonamia ostreae TaxID=126728 RepID=A0ABV2AHS8_9EUKA